ncbi:SDR family oxidoreductase [Candidatus Palauibacter sp.]|uniref:SDR family oxidoreductase n=1 Tax=Candidatus Palauibacter sp. TaxID=3101350 RepID=UPI003AF312BC
MDGEMDGEMDRAQETGALFAPAILAGRAAFITGGGSGIGYGIAECLAAAGASVGVFSRNEERVAQAADRLASKYGVRTLPTVGDVREPAALERAVRETREGLGSVDILINNAAGNFYAPTAELSPNGWRAVVEIDLFGTFHACRAAFPVMAEQGYGRIVSISMTLHYRGWPQMAHATAAKAGVDALTRTLAIEWARHGINVNAVAPGPIPTEGVRKAFRAPPSEDVDMFGARAGAGFADRFIPAGRLGHPHDIGRMVTYLCSPGGDWITGAILVVDGGESLVSPRTVPDATE